MTPFALAEAAGIPRTKIYETIRQLEKENWLTVEKGRPNRVTPVCPSAAIGSRKTALDADIDRMTQDFTLNYEKRAEINPPKTRLIRGIDNIATTTTDMMKRQRRASTSSAPSTTRRSSDQSRSRSPRQSGGGLSSGSRRTIRCG
jgi:HTH-type transcriptional regulator, sugar sensing transcriptional regulator